MIGKVLSPDRIRIFHNTRNVLDTEMYKRARLLHEHIALSHHIDVLSVDTLENRDNGRIQDRYMCHNLSRPHVQCSHTNRYSGYTQGGSVEHYDTGSEFLDTQSLLFPPGQVP